MNAKFEHTDGIALLKLEGEIDLHSSPLLRDVLLKASNDGKLPLLIDFSAVDYIDSSGLATFIEYLRGGNGRPRHMAFCGLKQRVRMVFELVRLHELFELHNSPEEAKASLQAKAADAA